VQVIPVSPVHDDGATGVAIETPGVDPTGRSVLVVDDSRFVRASLVRGLDGHFPLRQADSGERAWELIQQDESIAAVLSDLSMPGMDGFELLQRVRGSTSERIRRMPFAVLSGADDTAYRERAREGGADRFVVKGRGADELVDWVRASWVDAGSRPVSSEAASSTGAQPETHGQPESAVEERGAPAPAPAEPPRHDPLSEWLRRAGASASAASTSVVLIRVHAPDAHSLPERLRRGVRQEAVLHVADPDIAWLCVPAGAQLAVRLSLRLGLLAAGRIDRAYPRDPIVRVGLRAVSVDDPDAAATMLEASAAACPRPEPGLHLAAAPGVAGEGWECRLPWGLVRLLVG